MIVKMTVKAGFKFGVGFVLGAGLAAAVSKTLCEHILKACSDNPKEETPDTKDTETTE